MIVRIMGEGQVKLADADLTELNELDNKLLAAVEAGDEETFRQTLGTRLDTVRQHGDPLPADALQPSELILPGGDATLEEVRTMLREDGLIPG